MVPLGVMVMGDVQILIDVVESIGDFAAVVKPAGCQAVIGLGRIQQRQDLPNLLHIQKAVLLHTLAVLCGSNQETILKGVAAEGGMICINAGINHGNPAARTGIAIQPCGVASYHIARGDGIGIHFLIQLINRN